MTPTPVDATRIDAPSAYVPADQDSSRKGGGGVTGARPKTGPKPPAQIQIMGQKLPVWLIGLAAVGALLYFTKSGPKGKRRR